MGRVGNCITQGWMGRWMDGCKSHLKDCLQQPKSKDLNEQKLFEIIWKF